MIGAYRVVGAALRFEPQFPLHPGVTYRAVFSPGWTMDQTSASTPLTALFEVPAAARTATTRVSAIYPSGDVLPENLLKFYLHFSAPMRGGDIYRHIHLRDAQGREVAQPFLQIGEELWSPDMTRLTLLLDPGRIKRGLRLLEELGPALEAGGSYTLTIDRAWPDAAGIPLAADGTKTFRAAPADRTPLDPTRWAIRAPAGGSRDALAVAPGEALDRALALRLIRVFAAGGPEIEGDVELSANETMWKFVPDAAWRAGDYRLVVATTIEDLAGNNVGKPFDVDVFEKIDRRIPNESVAVPFSIR
ncbi:MAG: hypothetical protein HZA93_25290 [Verrucomicrobia bacterium]|nr:hypothetical protein [Verrucomicrobiota bacterium]